MSLFTQAVSPKHPCKPFTHNIKDNHGRCVEGTNEPICTLSLSSWTSFSTLSHPAGKGNIVIGSDMLNTAFANNGAKAVWDRIIAAQTSTALSSPIPSIPFLESFWGMLGERCNQIEVLWS
jgi:hypothetical protein